MIAITVHNFPEGMAVGVGFGSIGQSETATFANAFNLAIGIGLQNFPEGLAVSMPLRRQGASAYKSFMWGQLSGIVEPLGGVCRQTHPRRAFLLTRLGFGRGSCNVCPADPTLRSLLCCGGDGVCCCG